MRKLLAALVLLVSASQERSTLRSLEMLAACNRETCNVTLPPGRFSFSEPIAPAATVTIVGAGATYQNGSSKHCATTLVYTGEGIPVRFYGVNTQGSKLAGVCLDMMHPADAFVDVDQGADDVGIEDVVIDFPHAQARIAAMRWGYTSAVVNERCTHVFVRGAAPVAYMIGNVEAGWLGIGCHGVWNGEHEFQIGSGEYPPESVQCSMCSAEALTGVTPIRVQNVVGFWWVNSYLECGGNFCVDIPADATLAKAVAIRDSFIGYPPVQSFVHSALSTATIFVSGNVMTPAQLRADPTGYIVEDDALQSAVVTGNTIGLPVAKNGQRVQAFGNMPY